jgi:C1A family cysteine protease
MALLNFKIISDGGYTYEGFLWAKKNGGLCYEADYPYISGETKETGECRDDCEKDPLVAPRSYSKVERKSDRALMSAVAELPVAVSIQADEPAFQHYKSGVFTAECGTDLNHAVLVVGFGALDDLDFYKVKNSWGVSWGMDGYILLERGGNQKGGQCGILLQGVYPNL